MTEATATRKCNRCGVKRPLKDFYSHRKHARQCRYCQQAYMSARMARNLAYAQQIKMDAGCMDCGLMSPYPQIYDFDHRPGVDKVANVSRLFLANMNVLIAEIAKCDVVCANCHRIRTFTRKQGNTSFGQDRPRRSPAPVELDPMLDFGWPA